MAYSLPLPAPLPAQGWKVKIRDKERVEPPHVTILRGAQSWRWGLRERDFLDTDPPPREVAAEVMTAIEAAYADLVTVWNQMYPHNRV